MHAQITVLLLIVSGSEYVYERLTIHVEKIYHVYIFYLYSSFATMKGFSSLQRQCIHWLCIGYCMCLELRRLFLSYTILRSLRVEF